MWHESYYRKDGLWYYDEGNEEMQILIDKIYREWPQYTSLIRWVIFHVESCEDVPHRIDDDLVKMYEHTHLTLCHDESYMAWKLRS